jgi:hypothetical protein
VRVGDTMPRAAGPWTPTIHTFMLRDEMLALVEDSANQRIKVPVVLDASVEPIAGVVR